MKLLVIGHARHGKDTVCNLLRDMYGLAFVSSSLFVAANVVRPHLAKVGIHYNSLASCYADRVNYRAEWFNAIAAYNTPDVARLGKELFKEFDIYCGLRRHEEYLALKAEKAFDYCFWVDACERADRESSTSMTMRQSDADFVIDNNGPEDELQNKVTEAYRKAMNRQGG
jgi:hypothetical protein